MNLGIERLVFDPTSPSSTSVVGSYLISASGNLITSTLVSGKQALDVNLVSNASIAVDLNGIYNAGTNPTPDNAGQVFSSRTASPGITTQSLLTTAGVANADGVVAANVTGLDANSFLMGYNGTTWDRLSSINGGVLQVADSPNTAIKTTGVSVGATAALLVASSLANRRRVQIQNTGNRPIWIGPSTVTTSATLATQGLQIGAGSTETLELGPNVALYAIALVAGQVTTVLEVS